MKIIRIAALSGATLLLTTVAASAQAVCAVGLIFAASYIGAHENRELTEKEAITCGLSYFADKPDAAKEADKTKAAKKPAKRKHAASRAKTN